MLRTADDVLDFLRQRKEALQLSNDTIDELSGFTAGYWDKVAGPSRLKSPNLYTLMAFIGTLGLAVQLVEDPDARIQRRWTPRPQRQRWAHPNRRVSKAMVKRARSAVLHELASKAIAARWSRSTPEARAATVAMLNKARAAKRKRRTRTRKAA